MQELADIISNYLKLDGLVFDSVNCNLYENGGQSLGLHADDEALFRSAAGPTTIITFSLGTTRTFIIQQNMNKNNIIQVELESGSILVMTGNMQTHYKHGVPQANVTGPRLNFTFSYIYTHLQGCSCQGRGGAIVFQPQMS